MENIESAQQHESAQYENTESESADYEEDASTADNSDSQFLKTDSPTAANNKTDEEKVAHNTDNLLNISVNSPKTALLGRLKAKQRLQAFLLPKQSPFLNSPTKKLDDIQIPVKVDKITKKPKQSPIDKAKSIIEELEEMKKVEIAKVAKLLSPPLFKETRSSYKEKQYRKKSRSRSLELVRKISEKGRYPGSWHEIKSRRLSLENVQEIKLSKLCKSPKQHDSCYDFRKQLLFELPAQPLVSLKVKGVSGQDKTVPSPYIRFTQQLPSLSYSANSHSYIGEYLSVSEIYNYIPKSHLDIIKQCKLNSNEKFAEDVSTKNIRKWYPKQALNNITEGCELLEKSIGLSILQSYMDEEEEEERTDSNGLKINETKMDLQNENEFSLNLQSSLNHSAISDGNSKFSEIEELNNVEGEDLSPPNDNSHRKKQQSKAKEEKTPKRRKDKKEKKEARKRKRKKGKHEKEIKEIKKKKGKINKIDKKITDTKKEIKTKKKDVKLEKKVEIDEKKKYKEHKVERENVPQIEVKKEKIDEKNYKKERKEVKKDDKADDKKDSSKKNELKEDTKDVKKSEKKKKNRNSNVTSSVPLYYDEFESIRGRSSSREKRVSVDKVTQPKPTESSSHEVKKTDDTKASKHSSSRKKTKIGDEFNKKNIVIDDNNKRNNIIEDVKKVDSKQVLKHDGGGDGGKKIKLDCNKMTKQDNKIKEPERMKDDCLFKIQPLHQDEDLGTPDTEEYHSHWESDEDVSNVISYSPLLPRKLDTSWESDEDVNPDKMLLHDRYPEMSSRNRERSPERRTRKYFEGERSLEMPLNIVNLSRKESRKSGKFLDYPDRKFLNNDVRLRYEEDSWERGEFLKICNDIEGEKLRHERKTLSEERRLLELEKRKLAEKLEKRSFNCDIFDNLEDTIVKEVTYEKIHDGNDEVYLKSTDYIYDKRKSRKDSDYAAKKKSEHTSRKRTHSVEDHKRQIEEDKHYKQNDSKKFKYDKLDNIDVKLENESLIKFEIDDDTSKIIEEEKVFSSKSEDDFKPIDILDIKKSSKSAKHKLRDQSEAAEISDKPSNKTSEKVHPYVLSDVSERTCDSLLTSDAKTTSKSDILENEYEEFLKAVTSDITKSESKSKERKFAQKKREIKKKSRRRRKYSTSSSSSSSSDSDDSDSSSSSSSSSSYSSSSTSSYERQKKRRKLKAKRKKQQAKEKVVKIEMTHSIVKDLDDLQPFPISKTPIIQIKQEQEDPGYSKVPIITLLPKEMDNVVPLPVPSPAIVPPPYLNLLPVKQEKPDSSISSKADSTTSPIKKPPLIPTKFITPVPRKETNVIAASSILDIPKKVDVTIINKPIIKDDLRQSPSEKSSPFTSSIASKRSSFNDSTNDSDIQEFTEYLAKKSKIEEVRSCEIEFPIALPEKIEEEEAPAEAKDNTQQESSFQNELNKEVYKEVSPENMSRGSLASPPPKEIYDPERKHSESRDIRKKYTESSRRGSRKSVSPKYRNQSPRRDSLSRKTRDTSPYWKSSRHPDDPLTKKYSPRRRRSMERSDKRRKSPSPRGRKSFRSRTSISPRRRKSISPRSRRSPLSPRMRRLVSPGGRRSPSQGHRRSPSPRIRRSLSPRRCRSPSPGIRRSLSPIMKRSMSPRSRKSPFRNRSPNYRSSPPRKSYRRNYSRSPSPLRKKESIQRTLQRLAGIEDHYQQPVDKSPINSPVDGFKRSVADSTISDDQLLQQNFNESVDSPAYRGPSTRLIQSPTSPKRVPLDIRINQVLGLDKESPKPITTTYTQTNYGQTYTYEQYSEQYEHYSHYNQNTLQKENYIQQQQLPPTKPQTHIGSSKVLQIGNVLQVVPTEEVPPQEHKPLPTQKIVQVGNMLQIVPTPASHAPKEITSPAIVTASNIVPGETSIGVLQSSLAHPPPPPPPVDQSIPTISTPDKLSPEELMLQKIAERRAERAKRHEERERKKKEKEKRRKEKERKKQLRLKIKTENMIKKALRIETEALAMGENLDDEEDVMDSTPSCWPSLSIVANAPLKAAGKGILISQGFRTITEEETEQKKLKRVKFADGVIPGEGTSPSGGEELSSPPPPKEKRFKKMKKKMQKKKIKVKIIRKPSTDSPDDEELDNLPPPSPPPGSPPPHVFPARIKTHTINNIHPSYATGAPLMPVGSYTPQFRPNIPMSVPPPIHNLAHHVPSAPRPSPQIVQQHGPMLHGVPHSIPTHPHGLSHHSQGPRL